jgi:hypothetical protein
MEKVAWLELQYPIAKLASDVQVQPLLSVPNPDAKILDEDKE